MLNQCLAFCNSSLNMCKEGGRQPTCRQGLLDTLSHFSGGFWMGGVCFVDYRATCGQGRNCISSSCRKSKWKIARSKDDHRTQWSKDAADICSRQRAAVRHCRIDRGFYPGTFLYQIGKQPNLSGSPPQLSVDSSFGEVGLSYGQGN